MYFLPIFYTVLQLFALIAIGFFLKKFGDWSDSFFTSLSKFVVRISLPLYLFIKISSSDPQAIVRSPIFLLAAVVIMSAAAIVSIIVFTFLPFKSDEKRAGIAFSTFGNSGYFPLSVIEIFPITLPIISELFGTGEPTLYVGVYLLVNSPLLWSAGNYLMTGKGRRPGIKEIITPPFVGVLFGFLALLTGFGEIAGNKELPFFHIISSLERISVMTLPLILISLGAMIGNLHASKEKSSKLFLMAGATSFVRFLIMPALFYGSYFLFLKNLNLSSGQLWVLFLETHIPPASNLAVMAHSKGINEDYAAYTLMVTYGLYMIIFPFYLMLFLRLPGILP
ncbi:MAG: AEC family transporter [Spirochaetia bacterium]|jgi:predicted permease|nr:AEC family transporter [Spirochaetia bacterium]